MALGAKIIVVLRTKIIVSTDSGDSTDSSDSSDSTDSGDSGTQGGGTVFVIFSWVAVCQGALVLGCMGQR